MNVLVRERADVVARPRLYLIGRLKPRSADSNELGYIAPALNEAFEVVPGWSDPQRDRPAICGSSVVLAYYWRGARLSDGMRVMYAASCAIPIHVVDASWDGLPAWLAAVAAHTHPSFGQAVRFLLWQRATARSAAA